MSDRYYLFSGCLIPARLPYIERAAKFVLDHLQIDYADLPGATCCIEPIGLRSLGPDTWLAVTGRMLSLAERDGRGVISLCNGCHLSLKEADHALQDPGKRSATNDVLASIGRKLSGGVETRHFLEIVRAQGQNRIEELTKAPQRRLRLALHPGCHMIRPSTVLGIDERFSPRALVELTRWIGAEVVSNPDWPACCGGGLSGTDDALSTAILNENLDRFREAGANCILTPCPFCFVQYDLKQKSEGIPVLHLAELMALAFGARPEEIGLKYHRTKLSV